MNSPNGSASGAKRDLRTSPRSASVARSAVEASPTQDDTRFSRAVWLGNILRERVIDGTYRPGERIREAALQQEFGFSNGPIREALQRLVADGLAKRAPWQGVRVIELGLHEVVQLFELRSALLEFAAERAAVVADMDAVKSAEALRKNLARKFAATRAGRPPPVTGDTANWIMAVAGNPEITDVWHKTMLRSHIYVYNAMKRTGGASTEPIIYGLIDSILAHKPEAARKGARELTRQMLSDIGVAASAVPWTNA